MSMRASNSVKYSVHDGVALLAVPYQRKYFQVYIDEADLPLVSSVDAIYIIRRQGIPYAIVRVDEKRVSLHKYLLGLSVESRLIVDHKNGKSLDCRRNNLRACTQLINSLNRVRPPSSSNTKMRGVRVKKGKYEASFLGKSLGCFVTALEACCVVWMALRKIDPVSAHNYILSLPEDCRQVLMDRPEAKTPSGMLPIDRVFSVGAY